jgi:hypothetical protein
MGKALFLFCLAFSFGTWALEKQSFEERLKQAAEQARKGAEKAGEQSTQKVEQAAKTSEQKVSEQAAITTEKIRITVDNVRRAFEGQPLNPIPNENYLRAVYATQQGGTPDQVDRTLIDISPWNKNLIWKDAQKSHVLMVSWMPLWAVNMFYKAYVGKEFKTPIMENVYIWVTAVPQLKSFAQNYLKKPTPGISLSERLKQHLGLPESKDEYAFVEMWVRPQDIFRPCINTDIVSKSCVPNPNPATLPESYKDLFTYVPVKPEYKKWFRERRATTYTGNRPFPWTRLGYTHDWGSTTDKKFGATEFVINQGAIVFIHSITPTDEYPNLPTSEPGGVR